MRIHRTYLQDVPTTIGNNLLLLECEIVLFVESANGEVESHHIHHLLQDTVFPYLHPQQLLQQYSRDLCFLLAVEHDNLQAEY